jgi:hypothetical protein
MKKLIIYVPIVLTVVFITALFFACKKSGTYKTYGIYKPVFLTTAQVRNQIKSNAPTSIKTLGKIYVKDNFVFVNEPNIGIHIFDNTDPAHPVNKAFISIPGCENMAVFGNNLYADCFTDLLSVDISNPLQVSLSGYVPNLFPDRRYLADSGMVVIDWVKLKDTTIKIDDYRPLIYYDFAAYALSAGTPSSNTPGQGGSMARFAIQNQTLYTVSQYTLTVLGLDNPKLPTYKNTVNLGWGVETIYPFEDKLFIGSSSSMFIYDVSNAANPKQVGAFSHARVCDPVIADGHYAYVTLRNGTQCQGFLNELDVLDISDVQHPITLKTIALNNPRGLSKVGNTLVVCDGTDGLKVFNAADPANPTLIQKVPMSETTDIIMYNNFAIVSAVDGLYQFKTDSSKLQQISKIGQ